MRLTQSLNGVNNIVENSLISLYFISLQKPNVKNINRVEKNMLFVAKKIYNAVK